MKPHLTTNTEVAECKSKNTHMCSIIDKLLYQGKTVCFLSSPSSGLAKVTGTLRVLFRFLQFKRKSQNLIPKANG